MSSLTSLFLDCFGIVLAGFAFEVSRQVWAWAKADGTTPAFLLSLVRWLGLWRHDDSAGFVVRPDDEEQNEPTCYRPVAKPESRGLRTK